MNGYVTFEKITFPAYISINSLICLRVCLSECTSESAGWLSPTTISKFALNVCRSTQFMFKGDAGNLSVLCLLEVTVKFSILWFLGGRFWKTLEIFIFSPALFDGRNAGPR